MDIATYHGNVRKMRKCHDEFLTTTYENMVTNMDNNAYVNKEEIQLMTQISVSSFLTKFKTLQMQENQRSTHYIRRFQLMNNDNNGN